MVNSVMQDHPYCGPEHESCAAEQKKTLLRDPTCLVPCTGLYADIWDSDSLEETSRTVYKETTQQLMSGKALKLYTLIRCQCATRSWHADSTSW